MIGLDSFSTMCALGKGSYAQVYLVWKKDTNEIFAMKILNKEKVFSKN